MIRHETNIEQRQKCQGAGQMRGKQSPDPIARWSDAIVPKNGDSGTRVAGLIPGPHRGLAVSQESEATGRGRQPNREAGVWDGVELPPRATRRRSHGEPHKRTHVDCAAGRKNKSKQRLKGDDLVAHDRFYSFSSC